MDSEEKMELSDTSTREELPHELVVDILSRVPITYLWTLRCVCKSWFQLITSDPQFGKYVLDRYVQYKSNPRCIVAMGEKKSSNREKRRYDFYLAIDHTECDKAIVMNLPFLSPDQDPGCCIVCGICNGMLCISNNVKHEVHIWNPLTSDYITIPYPVTPLRSPKNRQLTVFGFGYLQSANEYKIIKLVSDFHWGELQYHAELSVYTLGKDSSWRTVAPDVPYGVNYLDVPCPQINGHVYWLARRDRDWRLCTLLGFDLKDEFLYEIDLPPIRATFGMTWIQELGGFLCLVYGQRTLVPRKDVGIWAMELNGGEYSWTMHYTFGRSEVVGNFSVSKPLGIVSPSRDILILQKNSKELITYNSSTKSINHLKEFCTPIVCAHAFFGSIISPGAIAGAGRIEA